MGRDVEGRVGMRMGRGAHADSWMYGDYKSLCVCLYSVSFSF